MDVQHGHGLSPWAPKPDPEEQRREQRRRWMLFGVRPVVQAYAERRPRPRHRREQRDVGERERLAAGVRPVAGGEAFEDGAVEGHDVVAAHLAGNGR